MVVAVVVVHARVRDGLEPGRVRARGRELVGWRHEHLRLDHLVAERRARVQLEVARGRARARGRVGRARGGELDRAEAARDGT